MNTTSDIVDKLGREEICDKLGLVTSAVSNACKKGKFPPSWYLPLKKMADDEGIELPDTLFKWRVVA